ncbi:ATP-binding protein [Streptomyces sp. DSM 116496]|uniref:ATP-binding protein n=1 Tax=Streptomyces stoeckheimensis TaxID=3344656 RepID=UPI0038B33CE5
MCACRTSDPTPEEPPPPQRLRTNSAKASGATWELDAQADAAELALTELVATVVRHVPGRGCTVLILCRPAGLRVEVSDGCPAPPLAARVPGPLEEGGRGLLLVEAVTDRWGTHPNSTGKTVWFECDARRPVTG